MHTSKVSPHDFTQVHVNDTRDKIPAFFDEILNWDLQFEVVDIDNQHKLLLGMVEYTLPTISEHGRFSMRRSQSVMDVVLIVQWCHLILSLKHKARLNVVTETNSFDSSTSEL